MDLYCFIFFLFCHSKVSHDFRIEFCKLILYFNRSVGLPQKIISRTQNIFGSVSFFEHKTKNPLSSVLSGFSTWHENHVENRPVCGMGLKISFVLRDYHFYHQKNESKI